ncbi:MAG: sugar-binding transcriptional regulator [Christensenellales bacterium]|jgi:deoxyribonucleoside regulator
MTKNFDALVYRVAKYYYIENLSQNDIAQRENISRSKVSRILERARASGIVKIEIKVPTSLMVEELQKQLQRILPVQRVIVVPASVSESTEETEEQLIIDVASVAAAHLPGMLSGCKTIGIGWGRTVYHIAPHLPFVPLDPERMFVPLVGNMTFRNRFLQTSINVSRFGERFGGQTYYLNISSAPGPMGRRSEAEVYNIRQIKEYWDQLDAAIFSLGAPPLENEIYLKDEMTMDMFSVNDVDPESRGEMLSQVFFSDGRPSCPVGKEEARVVALPLERLRTVPFTMLIAAGNYKAKPVYYACKNGYAKTLVIDHLMAEEILKFAQEEEKGAKGQRKGHKEG